jgi:hypothetical protein
MPTFVAPGAARLEARHLLRRQPEIPEQPHGVVQDDAIVLGHVVLVGLAVGDEVGQRGVVPWLAQSGHHQVHELGHT